MLCDQISLTISHETIIIYRERAILKTIFIVYYIDYISRTVTKNIFCRCNNILNVWYRHALRYLSTNEIAFYQLGDDK